MAKHTPGPWTVGSQVMGDGFNLWADSTGGVVAWIEPRRNREDEETGEMVVDPPDMTQHPDARLIAAAPDLLAACIAANRTMTALGDLGDLTYKPLRRAHSAVLYAIDRAEGRDSYHARYDTNLTEAARDLYDALRRLVAACPCDGPEWDAASAAIAKAEGRG